ncbi:MAG: hypothetical protein GY925_10370 [Actinomycetia bacterium]|nr:hypothetical protein [Actinomycetes bacterium]
MTGHRSWSELRAEVMARPGAVERQAALRAELNEEIAQYEARHKAALEQAGRDGHLVVAGVDPSLLDVEEYLDSIGARLEIIAVFDDGRRFPVHLASDDAL